MRTAVLALAGAALLAGAGYLVLGRSAEPGSGQAASLASYRPGDLHSLAVAAADPRTLVFGSHQGVLLSRDAGVSWSRVASGDAMGVAIAPAGAVSYAAGHDVLLRSDDGGATWRSVRTSLPGTDLHGLAAGLGPGQFYAFVAGRGLFRSTDGGLTWTAVSTSAAPSTMSLAVAGSAGSELLLAATMEGVQRSRDGGRKWERVGEIGTATVTAQGQTVYAAAGASVFISRDAGETWTRRTFSGGNGMLIAAAPSDPETVYVVTDRFDVYRSTDGGTRWERAG